MAGAPLRLLHESPLKLLQEAPLEFWWGGSSEIGDVNGNQLQYSCLENPMDGGSFQATVHGVAKSQTLLSIFTFTFPFHHRPLWLRW